MSLVRLFDFVDKDLNPVLHIEGLKNFYEKLDNPIIEYYTYDYYRSSLLENDLKYFLVGDFHGSEGLNEMGIHYKHYFFNLEIKSYENLIDLKKESDYDKKYVFFEEKFDRIQENIFESKLDVFYSQESANFIEGLEGQVVRNPENLNKYLKTFYDALKK